MKHVPPPEGAPLERLDNLAMAVPPKWGEAILRLAKATERVAAKLDELPATTDGQYIAKARGLAKSLIDFLDGLEDTDQDTASDDVACDDNELDGPENGEDEQSEPDEPSLGSGAVGEWSNQAFWSLQTPEYRSLANADLEDEHDGSEPDDHGGDGAKEDDEPSLGWPERLRQDYASNGSTTGSDLELQDHAPVKPQDRTDPGLGVSAEVTYRRFLRGLTPEQQRAFNERMRAGNTSGVLVR